MLDVQDPIRLLRDVPVDGGRLAAVRRRVLERLGARRPGPGRWVLAGAAAFGLAWAAAWLARPAEMELPAVAWTVPAPPDWALTPVRRAEDHGLPPMGRSRGVRPQQNTEMTVVGVRDGTALLEIPTSNPDVVLYWLVDGGGD